MQVARIQPPVALVSALCIAVVPFEGASAAHTNAGGETSTWGGAVPTLSIPYNLDFTLSVVDAIEKFATAAAEFADYAGKDLGSIGRGVLGIPGALVGCVTHPSDCASYLSLGILRNLASFLTSVLGATVNGLLAVGALAVLPVAIVADAIVAIGKSFGPAAATSLSASATPNTRLVTLSVKPTVTSAAKPTVTRQRRPRSPRR